MRDIHNAIGSAPGNHAAQLRPSFCNPSVHLGFVRQNYIGIRRRSSETIEQNKRKTPVSSLPKLALFVKRTLRFGVPHSSPDKHPTIPKRNSLNPGTNFPSASSFVQFCINSPDFRDRVIKC